MTDGAMSPCPPDSALMIAWNAHQKSDEYRNSFDWITRYIPQDDPAEIERIRESGANPWTRQNKIQAAEGSLWAMFSAGWKAAGGADPFDRVHGAQEMHASGRTRAGNDIGGI